MVRSRARRPHCSPAGIAARTKGKVLWRVVWQDLPALAQAGLLSGRVIYVKAGDDKAPASRKGCVTAVPAPLLPK